MMWRKPKKEKPEEKHIPETPVNTCPECGGRGKVYYAEPEYRSDAVDDSIFTTTCPVCNGSGRVDG